MKTTGANSAPVVLLGATTPGAPGPSGTWVFALRANRLFCLSSRRDLLFSWSYLGREADFSANATK
jgi:hypothetical protein